MKQRSLVQRLKKYTRKEEWTLFFRVLFHMTSIIMFIGLNAYKAMAHKKRIGKPIWLFCERGNDARDNGFVLFQYVCANHPEIDAYYVIEKGSVDTMGYKHVQETGKILHKESKEHKMFFLMADVLCETHSFMWVVPWNLIAFTKLKNIFPVIQKKIFLQHGITKDARVDDFGKDVFDIDMFICGAKPEYDYVLETLGFDKSVVKYTGFARFDLLHDFTVKNQILLMPTWRSFILDQQDLTEEMFLQTEYYRVYQDLLNNSILHEFLGQKGLRLIFYPHINVQPFMYHFTTCSDDITIANKDTHDVQQLLKESQLLVTDYSSVFFDFAYMKKPMVFYQFDEEEFFAKHYKKGYFDYRRDGFGPVVTEKEELLQIVANLSDQDFRVDEKYTKRVARFFPLHDTDNCKRTVDAINDIL